MTKRVLAAELGTISETFSRTLAKFREQKLLTSKAKLSQFSLPPN
jgi:CRP-like cAMP-binding protein